MCFQNVTVLLLYLQNQLHHLGVHQPMDGLPVDVGDQIPFPQTCLVRRTPFLHVLPTTRGDSFDKGNVQDHWPRWDSKPIPATAASEKGERSHPWHSQAQIPALLHSSQASCQSYPNPRQPGGLS